VPGGISFDGGTTIFDTVEEDVSFTPAPYGSGTAGSPTGTFTGIYSRYGRRVFGTVRLVFTDLDTMAGNFRISGLPYTADSNLTTRASIAAAFKINMTNDFVIGGFVLAGGAELYLFNIEIDDTEVDISDLSNTTTMNLTFNYLAA
jgi:hypothetical protein